MGLTVNETGGGDFKQVEPGSYVAICYRLVDLGTQHGEYQGKPTVKKQVMISWEFPNELIEGGEAGGKPFGVSKFYTASLNEKANLRKDLESWRGRTFTEEELEGFSLANILGKACLVNVIHDNKGKARVGAVMALPKGMPAPDAYNDQVAFDIDEWAEDKFDSLPDGIKRLVLASDEAKTRLSGGPIDQTDDYSVVNPPPFFNDDDDIPF